MSHLSLIADSLDCVLRREFGFAASSAPSSSAAALDSAHPVDEAAHLYLSGQPEKIEKALVRLLQYREETSRDPLAAGVDRQLQALVGSICCFLALRQFVPARALIVRTSEVVEKMLVGRDHKKHYPVSVTLLPLGLLAVYCDAERVDRKFLAWLLSDANFRLFHRALPQLLPLAAPLLLLADEPLDGVLKKIPILPDCPLCSFVTDVFVHFRKSPQFPISEFPKRAELEAAADEQVAQFTRLTRKN